jgi:polysaccharide pyruvyl transferase WcaK-like protein
MKGEMNRRKIAFFGHFDSTNFGNESTLQAILYNLRRFLPDADVTCISTGPAATIANHHIDAIPVNEVFFRSWVPQSRVTKALRKIFVGLPSEPVRWVKAFLRLRDTDMLIIPGTGLLTDAYGLSSWGPYNLFKWSLIAKACRCKLLFVSIGAGPIHGALGRYFVKSMLSLADFRSYRDSSSKEYLLDIGFPSSSDPVYPDLAFSLPETVIPQQHARESHRRPVVGLGVMGDSGTYGVSRSSDTYLAYLDRLATFVEWLLARDYDVRLLSGDVGDMTAWQEFGSLLRERSPNYDEARIIRQPISSVDDLLSQIAATDIVVATRFHNVLLASFCNKPVISISFHHKCESLMGAMGLSDYCLDIRDWNTEMLIDKFCELEKNVDRIRGLIREKAGKFREALDEQYRLIFCNPINPAPADSAVPLESAILSRETIIRRSRTG